MESLLALLFFIAFVVLLLWFIFYVMQRWNAPEPLRVGVMLFVGLALLLWAARYFGVL